MAIEVEVPVTVAAVEVSDDYRVEVTVTDPETMTTVTVSLTPTEAEHLGDELFDAAGLALRTAAEDFPVAAVVHGFDVDGPMAS